MKWVEFTTLESRFTFGKYRGQTLADVMDINPEYVLWCVSNIDEFLLHDNALEQIRVVYPTFPISLQFERRRKGNWAAYYGEIEDDELPDFEPDCNYDEEPTYDRYNGSYAQDVMGYSDDDIDTIFDGEPDAYWNID